MKTYLLPLLFILSSTNFLFAQMAEESSFKERRKEACFILSQLDTGVLIVRLTSNSRKMEQLKSLKNGKGVSKKRRQKYAEELKQLEKETRKENELLVQAFDTQYDFSQLLFMYDTATQYLSSGKQAGYFLDKELNIDPELNLKEKYYLIARYGFTTEPGQKRTKGLIIIDAKYEDMVPPFPYKQFQPLLSKAKSEEEKKAEQLTHIKGLVDNMNQSFSRYLNKCRYKGWMEKED